MAKAMAKAAAKPMAKPTQRANRDGGFALNLAGAPDESQFTKF